MAAFMALAVRKSVQEPAQVPATYIILAAPSASVVAELEGTRAPARSVKCPPVVEEVPNFTVWPAPTALPLKSFKVATIVVVPKAATDVAVFIATAAGRPATKLTRTDAGTPPV